MAGVMDVAGASPRRFFFEVLRAFTHNPAQAERLAYFASPAGREDLSKYNEREGALQLTIPMPVPTRLSSLQSCEAFLCL